MLRLAAIMLSVIGHNQWAAPQFRMTASSESPAAGPKAERLGRACLSQPYIASSMSECQNR